MLRLERVTPTGSRTVHFKRIGRSALLFGRLQRRARQPGPRARTSCLSFSCTSSFASVKLRCAKSPCGGATPRGWRGAGRWHGERRGRGTRGRQEERGQAQRCCTRNAPEPRARWRITDLVRDLAALSRLPPPPRRPVGLRLGRHSCPDGLHTDTTASGSAATGRLRRRKRAAPGGREHGPGGRTRRSRLRPSCRSAPASRPSRHRPACSIRTRRCPRKTSAPRPVCSG